MIPCKNCICVPICRKKVYLDLMMECELVAEYTHFFNLDDEHDEIANKRTVEVQRCLNSTGWLPLPEMEYKYK